MHGNELRKANRTAAAIARLTHALDMSVDLEGRAVALAFLARATGDTGDPLIFDQTLTAYRRVLDYTAGTGTLTNPFTFREIQLRGLLATGRTPDAVRIIAAGRPGDEVPIAPQWRVIERVTTGEVLVAAGDLDNAEQTLRTALTAAEAGRLPHQVQRAVRAAQNARALGAVVLEGRAALDRLAATLPDGS